MEESNVTKLDSFSTDEPKISKSDSFSTDEPKITKLDSFSNDEPKTLNFENEPAGLNFQFIPKEEPIIRIKQGQIKGKMVKNFRGTRFYSFQSIPYAKPPLGELRFKAPQPPEEWTDILDATVESPQCFQRHSLRYCEFGGLEDCLYLNVYTPNVKTYYGILLPVMVWIHGGYFMTGSSKTELYGPDYLLSEYVVVVTINYRIGMLGFLSMEDESLGIYGNAGLKDQVMALKWIKQNIKKFGGSPKNVTIFGQGGGAACVHLHMLSPMSKGLFHKVIMQSGCALNPWANGVFGTGKLLAEALELDEDANETEILTVLQTISVEELLEAQETITEALHVNIKWVNSPVVERQKDDNFLPNEPLKIILSGDYTKVPMIIGYNSIEGLYWDNYNILTKGCSELITDFTTVIPNNLNVRMGNLLSETMAKQIKEFYYGTREDPNRRNKQPFIDLMTDVFFLRGIYSTIKNHLETSDSPIYFYRFSLETDLNIMKNRVRKANRYRGASHGDELGYLFKHCLSPEVEVGSIEDSFINQMVKFWTNFAESGDPASGAGYKVLWKSPVKGCLYYIDINENFKLRYNPEPERMRFWNSIYLNDKRTKFL